MERKRPGRNLAFGSALEKKVRDRRTREGRKADTAFLIGDSQSVANADTAGEKGYDGGKKISGIKRHVAVDVNGFPFMIHVTPANVGDREGALRGFVAESPNLPLLKAGLFDGGFTGDEFASKFRELTGAEVQIAKKVAGEGFKVIPKRWIVERCFAWLGKCRRLWKNCERKLETSRQMCSLAFLSIVLKRY